MNAEKGTWIHMLSPYNNFCTCDPMGLPVRLLEVPFEPSAEQLVQSPLVRLTPVDPSELAGTIYTLL
jgi:hypothetical protein